MIKQILFLALLLVIPTVTAEATIEGSFQEYNLDTYAETTDNPPTAAIFVNTVNSVPQHNFAIADSYAIIQIHYTARFADTAAGIWRYEAFWDDVLIPQCIWNIETVSSISPMGQYPTFTTICRLEDSDLAAGDHEFIISRSTATGAPAAINHEAISYTINRIDELVPDMTNETLEAFAAIAPFLALILIIIWAEITREWLIHVLAIFVAGVAMFAIWSEIESLRIVIAAVALLIALRGYFLFEEDKSNANEA